jgi:hypothetical protein
MNWKGRRRNRSLPKLKYYSVIYLEIVRKTTKIVENAGVVIGV